MKKKKTLTVIISAIALLIGTALVLYIIFISTESTEKPNDNRPNGRIAVINEKSDVSKTEADGFESENGSAELTAPAKPEAPTADRASSNTADTTTEKDQTAEFEKAEPKAASTAQKSTEEKKPKPESSAPSMTAATNAEPEKPKASKPTETKPATTEPAVTVPAETEPTETSPAVTEPAVTEPAETEPTETEPAETEPARTEPKAMDFTVYDENGNAVKLSDHFGKPIVLNFWASWCAPCKREMPDFNEKHLEHSGEVQFLMVNLTGYDTVEDAKAVIEANGYSFPVLYDIDSEAASVYGVTSFPTTYFIDAEGYLIAYAKGAISADTLQEGIDMIS